MKIIIDSELNFRITAELFSSSCRRQATIILPWMKAQKILCKWIVMIL